MDDPNGNNEREAKPNAYANPQLIRLRSLQSKKKAPKTKTPRAKRRPISQRSPTYTEKEHKITLSAEVVDEAKEGEAQNPPKQKSLESVRGNVDKPLTWNDTGGDELERRLEKLNKILQEIKDEKIRRIRESVKNWEEKYTKRLTELESSMLTYAERCQNNKAELNDQIVRVEEMSDANMKIRQRIEKKLVIHGPRVHAESKQTFLPITLSIVRGILYYIAQIRDAFFYPPNPYKPATPSASDEALAIEDKPKDDSEHKKVPA